MNKRILIHDYAGHPFQVQLSRELAHRGYKVLHLYFGYNNSPKGDLEKRTTDPDTFRVEGVYTKEPFRKYSYIKRLFQEIEYGKLIAERIKIFKPDFVLSANTPLDSQKSIMRACTQEGTKFNFWFQDAIGMATRQLLGKRLPILGYWIGAYYQKLEKRMVRASDQVILISEDYRPLMTGWGIAAEKVHVIPNWATLNKSVPQPKQNPWAVEHELAEPFCFLYSGTLGLKHNPELFIFLAQSFRSKPDVRIVVVSEGEGAEWLTQKKEVLGLHNLIVMPFQAVEIYPQVLGAADVLVSVLNAEAGAFSVPSKVLTYLCAGRPLLLSVPPKNLAARTVLEARAGLVSASGEVDQWLEQAGQLYADSALRSQLGSAARAYAEKTFDIEKITDQFEAIFSAKI
jgi:glycosyltransferase involved in cell wall biosynthesis